MGSAGERPEHPGLFEAFCNQAFAACLNDARADEEPLASERSVAHALGIGVEVGDLLEGKFLEILIFREFGGGLSQDDLKLIYEKHADLGGLA